MKSETTEIDGVAYEVTQLGAKHGRRVVLQLSKAMSHALGGDGADALEGAIDAIDPNTFDEICDLFAGSTMIVQIATTTKGPQQIKIPLGPAFDKHFAGRYVAMVKWLAFCLKLNFSDFFDGAANIVQGFAAKLQPVSDSEPQKGSIGSSGES